MMGGGGLKAFNIINGGERGGGLPTPSSGHAPSEIMSSCEILYIIDINYPIIIDM